MIGSSDAQSPCLPVVRLSELRSGVLRPSCWPASIPPVCSVWSVHVARHVPPLRVDGQPAYPVLQFAPDVIRVYVSHYPVSFQTCPSVLRSLFPSVAGPSGPVESRPELHTEFVMASRACPRNPIGNKAICPRLADSAPNPALSAEPICNKQLTSTAEFPLPIPFPITSRTQSHSARLPETTTDDWRTGARHKEMASRRVGASANRQFAFDRPLGASDARLGVQMDTDGARRLNRSSPSCLNSGAQRTDFFHGLLGWLKWHRPLFSDLLACHRRIV